MKTHTISRFALATVALTGTLAITPAHAIVAVPVDVSATYQGIIESDSGLGLVGETMTVAFSYDASTPADPYSTNSFSDAITAMTVSIGSNTWTFNSAHPFAGNYISLRNDDLIIYSAGIEDRWTSFTYEFTGPSLTVEPAEGYSLDMYFYDNVPTGAPDGLDDDLSLPTVAPDPAMFTSYYESSMVFSFYTGDPEIGDTYYITARNLQQVTAVPEPESYAMWLAGVGLLGAVARRRRI